MAPITDELAEYAKERREENERLREHLIWAVETIIDSSLVTDAAICERLGTIQAELGLESEKDD